MYKAYVTGIGWCCMQDGEIVEVISQEGGVKMAAIDYNKSIEEGLRLTIDQWFTAQALEPSARFYLYYKPQNPLLMIAKDAPNDEWRLATASHINGGHAKERVFNFCWGVSRSLPILPVD